MIGRGIVNRIWRLDSPKYQDTSNSVGKKETKAMVFHKMDTEEVSDRFVAPCFVNGPEAYDGEINIGVEENMISNEYAILKKKKKKSMDDWDQFLDFNLDDIPLLGGEEIPPFVCKMGKSKSYGNAHECSLSGGGTTLIAKFLILDIPINRNAPIVVGRGFLHTIGGIVNTPERLFLTFDGFCHQTFRAARSDVIRNGESDSDDEEEYEIKRNKFGAPIYGPKPAPYLNCNDPAERSLAIQTVTNPLWKISVWKKAVSFLGSLPVPLKHVNWKPGYKGCYTKEEEATGQWRTEMRLIQMEIFIFKDSQPRKQTGSCQNIIS
ncbi:hypothetical protein Tco_0060323 [Tanacetum coccineum]